MGERRAVWVARLKDGGKSRAGRARPPLRCGSLNRNQRSVGRADYGPIRALNLYLYRATSWCVVRDHEIDLIHTGELWGLTGERDLSLHAIGHTADPNDGRTDGCMDRFQVGYSVRN